MRARDQDIDTLRAVARELEEDARRWDEPIAGVTSERDALVARMLRRHVRTLERRALVNENRAARRPSGGAR